MKLTEQQQMSESFLMGALLAIVGGYLDAYTYIVRGHVFSNAQTGNIVLLGINLAEGHFYNVLYYLVPILAFIFGVLVTEIIKNKFKINFKIHWRQLIIVIEILILFIVAFIPTGALDVLANISVSFVCAMQVESFRKVHGNAFASTMCTGNLRSAAERLYKFMVTRDEKERVKSIQYYGIITFFIGGAALGAVLSSTFGKIAVLYSCIILAIAFLLMFIKEKN